MENHWHSASTALIIVPHVMASIHTVWNYSCYTDVQIMWRQLSISWLT